MLPIIDDDFGDLSIINIIHDEVPEALAPALIDDDFGDLSLINIIDEPNEITIQPDPIDPVKAGIEIISTNESFVEYSDESLEDFKENTQLQKIKAYNEKIKDLPKFQQAEIAINEPVENPLLYSFSPTYLYSTPLDLSLTAYRKEKPEIPLKGLEKRLPKSKPVKEIVAMPNIVDTEYQTWLEEFLQYFSGKKKLNLTVQIKGIHNDASRNIYSHWHIAKEGLPSHFPQLTRKDSCIWERYLKDNGYDVEFKLCDSGIGEIEYLEASAIRVFQIPIYGHMLQADFMGCIQPNTPIYRYFERIISGRDKSNFMSGKKRLEAESDKGELLRPRILIINRTTGDKWAIEFPFIDTQSLHGIGKSLGELAQVTNTNIADDKTLYSKSDKARMLAQYLKCNQPEEKEKFTRYAVGADLSSYQILINNAKAFHNLYSNPAINAAKYYSLPRLTIGRSVADIIKARLLTMFETDVLKDLETTKANLSTYLANETKLPIPTNSYDQILQEIALKHLEKDTDPPDKIPKELQTWMIDTFCVPSSAMNLAGLSDTRRLNAKIQGGRAFRNRPLDTVIEGVIGEPDIDGAYNSMMRALDFPLCANPFTTQYSLKGSNQGMTVGQFREKYKDELLPGLYQIWGSCIEDSNNFLQPKHIIELPTAQDLLPSYHPHSAILNTTTGAEWLTKYDESYYYSNQVTNAIFTHWQHQIIDTVFSKELKQSLMNAKVVTSIMYRKSDRIDNIRELLDGYRNYHECNRYKIRGNREIIDHNLYRGWFGINIGDLIATPIRIMRNMYPKGTAENTFFKLIGNTVYGVLCSKYFPISNVVVANNITSGVRTGVYCLEKGLNCQNSVTDGGIPDLLKAAYAQHGNQKLSDKNTVQTHRIPNIYKTVRYAPIGGYKDIYWIGNEKLVFVSQSNEKLVLERKAAVKHVDQLIYEHLAAQFPKLDLFHLPFKDEEGNDRKGIIRIESKGIIKKAVCRGATDYLIEGGFHKSYGEGEDKFAAVRSYRKGYGSNAQLFMEDLGNHPDAVNRSEIFEQSILLKIGLWQERYRTYFENSDFMVGDTFFLDKLIKEFSMSAFCFKNAVQRQSWKREIQQLNQTKGQSIESLFLNDNNSVNTDKMNSTFDMWIDAGYCSLSDALGRDKGDVRNNLLKQEHPEFEKLQKKKTSRRQGKRR